MNRTFLPRPVAATVASEIIFLNAVQARTSNPISNTVTPFIGGTNLNRDTEASIATMSMEHTGNTDRQTNLVAHKMSGRTKWNSSAINVHRSMLFMT